MPVFHENLLPAVQAFSLGAQFARESPMLKLPEERRRWGESKGRGERAGREKRKRLPENTVKMRIPPPPPLPLIRRA